jgi:hypothetical protein
MREGLEKSHGEPKRARNWKRWIHPRECVRKPPFQLMQPNSEAVGPMELPTARPLGPSLMPMRGDIPVTRRLIHRDEAFLGTYPDRGRKLTRFLKKGSPIDQDTEGRVGEALERPPFRRSREGVPDPCQTFILDTDEVSRNI